jgi:valyl-tRNA synthetase
MPFVAESLWQALNEAAFERGLPAPEPAAESVTIAPWPGFPLAGEGATVAPRPGPPPAWKDAAVEASIARMQELVRALREVRNRYTIDPKTAVDVSVRCNSTVAEDFRALAPFITALAGVGRLESGPDTVKPKQSATCVSPEFEAYVSLAGLIDVPAELARLEKQKAEKLRVLQGARAKLANSNFVDRAPADVVQQEKDRVNDLQAQIQVIEENLRDLRQA